jgi:hypothetical protein
MTDEKKPFSFGASFTAPSVDPTPAPAPEPVSGVTLDDILSVELGLSSTWLCTQAEADAIYEKTRGLRQQGRLRIKYEDGELTVRRVKD